MNDDTNSYPVVGRNPDINLAKYTVKVHGRMVIDYEKLKHEEPGLYQDVIDQEAEWSRLDDIEAEKGAKRS